MDRPRGLLYTSMNWKQSEQMVNMSMHQSTGGRCMRWYGHGELLQVEIHTNTSSSALGIQISLQLSGSGLQVHEEVLNFGMYVQGIQPSDRPHDGNNQ